MGHNTSAGHPHPPDVAGRPATVPAHAANGLRWRQVLQGEQPQLAVLRRWLASMLPDCPARDDVISVATELASNALRHTVSGRGGWFAVEVTRYQSVVRIAVADQGGPAEPHVIEDPDAEHGRGLLLVRGLSLRTGVTGDQRGRLVWADVAFGEPGPAVMSRDPYEAAILDGQAALTRRFGNMPAWFGRSTLAWWALADPGELVTASSAPELASLLYRRRSSQAQRLASDADRARQAGDVRRAQRGAADRESASGTQPDHHPGTGSGGRDHPGRSRRNANWTPWRVRTDMVTAALTTCTISALPWVAKPATA